MGMFVVVQKDKLLFSVCTLLFFVHRKYKWNGMKTILCTYILLIFS